MGEVWEPEDGALRIVGIPPTQEIAGEVTQAGWGPTERCGFYPQITSEGLQSGV